MTQAFPVSGNIEPATFPHLLVDLHGRGATGSLKITGPHHPKALYFRGGRVLFGSSNDPRDQLGSILIESGKITREQLDEVNEKVGPGNPLAKVLSESGFVNQRELGDAARVKVERILADVLSWDTGTFEFEDGVLPKGAVDLKLSTEKLLLSAVQRIPDRSFALRHVELRTVLAPSSEGEAALSEIRAEVWPLLERLDGQRTLKDAIALTRLDEFEAAKTACALLFLGVVRKSQEAAAGEELDLAREAQSGLGAEDDSEPALFTMPSQQTVPPGAPLGFTAAPQEPEVPFGASATEATVEPAQDEEAPFVFPEPAPPPTPDLSFGVAPEQEPEPRDAASDASARPSFPGAEPAPSYPSPSFPSLVETPSAPIPDFSGPAAPEPEVPNVPMVATREPSVPTEPPARASFDTVAAERPAYRPASGGRSLPLIPPPPRKDAPSASRPAPAEDDAPEISVAPSSSRPNLKALDELLGPAGSGRRPSAERSRSDTWQPQFRPATAARRAAPRTSQASSSRIPVILSALLMVVVGTAAAWYFLLRTPAAPAPAAPATTAQAQPTPTPRAAATPTPATVVASPAEDTSAPAPSLAPAATPPPPLATPSPRPTPVSAPATSSAAGARVLLGRGALPEAAREFAASLRPGSRTRFSVQILTACAPETVEKAVGAAGSDQLIILPVTLDGRSCYRLCWGVYRDRQGAEAALATVPSYFRQGGAKPRVSPLAELLP